MGGVRRLLALMVAKQRQLAGDRRQRDGASIEFNAGRRHPLPAAQHGQHRHPGADLRGVERRDQPVAALPAAGPGGRPAGDVLARRRPLEAADLRAHRPARDVRGAVRARDAAPARPRCARPISPCRWTRRRACTSATSTTSACCARRTTCWRSRSDIPTDQLAQRLPGLCKIASRTQLPQIIRVGGDAGRADPGHPPAAAGDPDPRRRHLLHPERSERVLAADHRRNGSIAIYLPPPFGPEHVKLELLAVPRRPADNDCQG